MGEGDITDMPIMVGIVVGIMACVRQTFGYEVFKLAGRTRVRIEEGVSLFVDWFRDAAYLYARIFCHPES